MNIKIDTVLNPKFPGGVETQKKILEKEGFTILHKGKRYIVKNYENYLMKDN